MILGSHVSCQGGFAKAVGRAVDVGCNCLQVFVSNPPRQWPVFVANNISFHFIDLPQNLGYGGALKKAIDASNGEYAVTIDSDGQFDIDDMPKLLEKLKDGYDCVTGYRMKKKDTLPRVIANWGYNLLVKMLCGISYTDAQCALKIYSGDTIRSLTLEARGFTFPTEALIKLNYYDKKTTEMGIVHRFREGGESKVKFFQTVRIMFIFLLYIRFKRALHKSRIIYTF